jgi:hypothetical protein
VSDVDRALLRQIAEKHRELGDLYDALAAEDEATPKKRAKPVRQPPTFSVVPNDLQRARADHLLKSKGLAR